MTSCYHPKTKNEFHKELSSLKMSEISSVKHKIIFDHHSDKKSAVRYNEINDEDGKQVIGSLYLKNWAINALQKGGKYPRKVKVTIKVEDITPKKKEEDDDSD